MIEFVEKADAEKQLFLVCHVNGIVLGHIYKFDDGWHYCDSKKPGWIWSSMMLRPIVDKLDEMNAKQ